VIFMTKIRSCQITLVMVLALAAGGCATLQPPNVAGPRGNEKIYPIMFAEDNQRREASVLALNRLIQPTGSPQAFGAELQPITATIKSLPGSPVRPLQLPKVGLGATMNDDETREALRRFIRDSRELIGSDPAKLSLVELADQPDGSKLALYQQRPFRFPIRGNYGKLEIRFTTDRRIINLSSTCIPQADRIQAAFAALNVRPKFEDAVKQIRENGIMYTDTTGNASTLRIPGTSEINTRGLVIYVLPSKSQPDTLEFRLAWEIEPGVGSLKLAYVDAINGDTIAVE
jgi:hypothetical protein